MISTTDFKARMQGVACTVAPMEMRMLNIHSSFVGMVLSLEACVWASITHAQSTYPAKPVRLVAATAAAGQPDYVARILAQKLSDFWGKPVVVDNRPSAGGTLAAAAVAKATPDGYTLLYVVPSFVTSEVLQPSLPYDPRKDFSAISQVGFSTNIMVAGAGLNVKNAQELIALAKAQPGKLLYGSSGTGTASHLVSARFNQSAGIKAVHVAYKSGVEVVVEILSGRAHYTVSTMSVALPFIKEGKMMPIGVATPQRSPVLPDVPSLGEIFAEFKQPETSHNVLAPAGTPRAIIHQVSRDIARALNEPDVKAKMHAITFILAPSTPEATEKQLRAQVESLRRLVKEIGLLAK
jgi:tripartite-type tricarboxylate transporter receptor subunit TctC